MADDAHDLSEIEQLEQRLQVTTIFAARLAAYLVSKTRLGLNRGDIKKITRGLKPAERERVFPPKKKPAPELTAGKQTVSSESFRSNLIV